MAQNINPALIPETSSLKTNEERQNLPKDSHAVAKRYGQKLYCLVYYILQKELMVLMMGTEKGISAFPEGENLFKWIGTIHGPIGTVYEGLSYKLSLEFPNSYPYTAPVVKFSTPCFHPNVDLSGNICLDILKEKWSALYDVRTILLSIQSLLGEPNNDSPLNVLAAEMWKNQEYYKTHLRSKYEQDTKGK
ncbi:hypothetical protein B566_EDAN008148 [Ephemera danica]|nr:hypothetical protein B566_EDAN008148 [Ephemera danica]